MGYETTLTDARAAMWQAIDNFADLSGAFKKKYKFDDEGSCMVNVEPGFSDLTAIAAFPLSVTPRWYTNEKQFWPYSIRLVVWSADWRIGTAEQLMCKIAKAIMSATPQNSTAPYTALYQPVIGPNFNIQFARINESTNPVKVVKSSLDVVLRTRFQPFNN